MDHATELPAHEVIRLKMAASGLQRVALAAGSTLDAVAEERFATLVERRRSGEPLQFLEGTVQFGPIELGVDRRALIPRPETEVMWEDAVRSLGDVGPGTVIVDMCTGSGALALALKHSFPQAKVFATDLDSEALALAAENAAALGLDVTFLKGDLFEALPENLKGRIDLLVVNPPYVSEAEWSSLDVEITANEPRSALVAGPEGTETIARIADEAYWWLGIGGWLFCEIGSAQGAVADELFGSLDREVRQDLARRDRYVAGRKGASCCL
ncbi:MAG: peptide chain release factor N(5)-glutamine methyltransferase [Acidimicrobiia bacterium]